MLHLYFFRSSNKKDRIFRLTVFTHSVRKAYALAQIYFLENGAIGVPERIAI